MPVLKVKNLTKENVIPTRGTEYAAGLDLYNADADLVIGPGCSGIVLSGVAVEIPEGYFGHISIRSGLGFKMDLSAHIGVVDSDYRGEIGIKVFNHGSEAVVLPKLSRVAQLVIIPYNHLTIEEVDELEESVRGENGYGSTGTM